MKNKRNPLHQKETEFHGSFQEFSGTVVSPDHPSVKNRVRRVRPGKAQRGNPPKKRGGKAPKK
jgi:hypothetical protein